VIRRYFVSNARKRRSAIREHKFRLLLAGLCVIAVVAGLLLSDRRVANTVRSPLPTWGAWAYAKATGARCTANQGQNICYKVRGIAGPTTCITQAGTTLCKKRSIGRTLLAHETSHGGWFAVGGYGGFMSAWLAGEGVQEVVKALGGRLCNPIERYANHGRRNGCGHA
jgi:hypothetical protein